MSPNAQKPSCWSRWARTLARGAASALTAIARRAGGPTLLGVPVSAAILTRVVAAHPQQPLDEVAQLFVSGHVVNLPVIDQGRAVSVITRSDVAAGLARLGPHATVSAAPSHHVVAVTPSDSLAHVLIRLEASPDSIAVVIDHDRPVGVLTAYEVAAYLDDVARRTV
jgi:predicted transcriptional regulator